MAKVGRDSGQFPLRLPEGLRGRIKSTANALGRSMNAEIVRVLEKGFPKQGAGTDSEPALQIVGEIGKISLQPGDVLVLSVAVDLSPEQCERLGGLIHGTFPDHRYLILAGGAKLEVARNAPASTSKAAA